MLEPLSRRNARRRTGGFTLVELIVVVAVLAVVLGVAAPGFFDYLLVQRLKGTHAQVVTDLQFARSEAVSRATTMRVDFRSNASASCYTIHTLPSPTSGIRCDCLRGPGNACTGLNVDEVRTQSVARSSGVRFELPFGGDPFLTIDSVNGSLVGTFDDSGVVQPVTFVVDTTIGAPRTLRTSIGIAGRIAICGLDSRLGAPSC